MALLTDKPFDLNRAASMAAGAAVAARASRRAGAAHAAETPDPTAPRSALDRFRSFDPLGLSDRAQRGLERLGRRIAGQPAELEIGPARPRTEPAEETTAPRREREEADTSTRRAAEQSETADGRVRRSEAEVSDAAARSREPLPPDTDTNAPATRLSDSELANTTTRSMRVGDTDHHTGFRRRDNHVVGEVCSAGCLRVEQALRLAESALPPGPLRDRVVALRERVERLQSQLAENIPSISHRDLLELSGEVANTMREAGSAARELGRILENPRLAARGRREAMFEHTYEPRAPGEAYDRIRVDNLAIPDGPRVASNRRQTIDVVDIPSLKLHPDDQVIYVVRDKRSGAIAKVGETDGSAFAETFGKYRAASEGIGLGPRGMEIEVNVVRIENLPEGMTAKQARRGIETELRHRLEGEGHLQPWENYDPAGRMGREGSGIPFVHPGGGHGAARGVGHGARGTPAAGWRPLTGEGGVPGIRSDAKAQPEAVAQHIRDMLRGGSNLTRAELARRIGVHPSRVSKWFEQDAWKANLREHGVDVSTWPPRLVSER